MKRAICVRVDDSQYEALAAMAARRNDSVPGVLLTAWSLLELQECVTQRDIGYLADAGQTVDNGRYVLPCGCVPPCEGHHEDES